MVNNENYVYDMIGLKFMSNFYWSKNDSFFDGLIDTVLWYIWLFKRIWALKLWVYGGLLKFRFFIFYFEKSI